MSIVVSVSTNQYVNIDIETDVELEPDKFVEGLSEKDAWKLLLALQAHLEVASNKGDTIQIPSPQPTMEEYVKKFDELNRLKR